MDKLANILIVGVVAIGVAYWLLDRDEKEKAQEQDSGCEQDPIWLWMQRDFGWTDWELAMAKRDPVFQSEYGRRQGKYIVIN